MRSNPLRILFVAALVLAPGLLRSQDPSTLTWQQKEEFLKKAKVIKRSDVNQGVTGTQQVTLSDGTITHDASLQRINDRKLSVQLGGRTVLNFKDYYGFDVAAWKLARLLGIGDMTPVSVQRGSAAYRWWIDDVEMDETKRLADKIQPPDPDVWRKERDVIDVFDNLIYNWDRNQGNFVYDKQWHVWMVDHTRAFRLEKKLLEDRPLRRCDRQMLAAMKTLTEDMLRKEFGNLVTRGEVQSLLARRDLIVQFFDQKGEAALFDRPARN